MKRIVLITMLLFGALTLIACAATPTATPIPPPPAAPTQAPAPTTAPAPSTAAPSVAATKAPTFPAASPTTAAAAAPTPTSIRASITGSGCNLILATTTSTQDSGLLDFILPDFQKKFNCKVDVVAVGTGQAIAIGQKGDADVLLVHARAQEDKFVADGHAKERFDVMYNDFILVGPKSDPAQIIGMKSSTDAFKAIAAAQATFASRGDASGTNTKELSIWTTTGITPTKSMSWYNALGQGMGETLLFSEQRNAYTLSDRATWLATKDKLPDLIVLLGGNNIKENSDKNLLNPYGVMAVNPDKHPGVSYDMALNFVNWIIGVDEQKVINTYGADKFGQQLFYASSKQYLQSLSPSPTSPSSPPSPPSGNAYP